GSEEVMGALGGRPKSAPQIHHYIPQCYLLGFVEDAERPRLFTIDLETRRTFSPNPKNIGAERDFNTYLLDGESKYNLEHAISLFEDELAPVLRDFDQSAEFAGECRVLILNLIAALALRNPRMRATMESFVTEVCEMVLSLTLQTRERWESQVRR